MSADHDHLLTTALKYKDVREVPRNSNRGPDVERFLKLAGGRPGDPWCAAFVTFCGLEAWGAQWPLAKTTSTWAMFRNAEAKGLLIYPPLPGCIFFIPHSPTTGHVGFLVTPPQAAGTVPSEYWWGTVEGNSNDAGSREGWGVFQLRRRFLDTAKFIYPKPR